MIILNGQLFQSYPDSRSRNFGYTGMEVPLSCLNTEVLFTHKPWAIHEHDDNPLRHQIS